MQEQELIIYRDGELVQAPVAVRLGQSVLDVLKTATAGSIVATGRMLGQAATDISLYHEDRELWHEWKQTRHDSHVQELRTRLELV